MQELAIGLRGRQILRRRYGGEFATILSGYERRDGWSQEAIETYRFDRLRAQLRHAVATVPHYQTAAYRGLDEIASIADLRAFPLLTKAEVRDLGPRLHSQAELGRRSVSVTSGTTGSPLQVPSTRRAEQEQWATWWRYRGWHGIRQGEWCGFFGGKPIAVGGARTWRLDRGQRRVLFSAYHTSPSALDAAIEQIRERGVHWIHGYPSVIALLANRVVDRNLVGVIRPRWVTFGSENVLSSHRDVVATAFGVHGTEHYGAAEMVANLSECEHHQLHVDEDFSVVEAIDDEIVGTTLVNQAFPLVRYRTGDTARISGPGCACGRPGRIASGVDGRLDDYLILADGSRIGRLSVVVKGIRRISAAQFVQRAAGIAELNLVTEPDFTEDDLRHAHDHVHSFTRGGLDLRVIEVESLTRTKAGKTRLVVQETSGSDPNP